MWIHIKQADLCDSSTFKEGTLANLQLQESVLIKLNVLGGKI